VVLLGGSVLGHAAAAVLPSQLSVGPAAGLVALLVATARLQPEQLRTDARSVLNLRRAALGLLGLHLPLLVLWPAVSPLGVGLGVALGLVLGVLAPQVARVPRIAQRLTATALLAAALAALAAGWQTQSPWQLTAPIQATKQRAAGWQFAGPSQLLVSAKPVEVGQGSVLWGDAALDVLVASAVPAPADVTAVAEPQTQSDRLQVATRAVVADCTGRFWLLQASVLQAAPAPWHDAAAALVASVRPVCP